MFLPIFFHESFLIYLPSPVVTRIRCDRSPRSLAHSKKLRPWTKSANCFWANQQLVGKPRNGYPNSWMVLITENPMNLDYFRLPPFQQTSKDAIGEFVFHASRVCFVTVEKHKSPTWWLYGRCKNHSSISGINQQL